MSVFTILVHPGILMVYDYLLGVFLSFVKYYFQVSFQFNFIADKNMVKITRMDGQNNSKHRDSEPLNWL